MPDIQVACPSDHSLIFTCHDDHLSHVMMRAGRIYEWELLAYLAEAIPRDGLWIDVGANIGTHSIFFAKLGVEVLAFEPIPENVALLKQNRTANSVMFQIVQMALSSGMCRLPMTYNAANMGNCRVVPTSDASDIQVPCTTLDSYMHSTLTVLLKIDVEGHEVDVLKGAERTIALWHPWIAIEVRQGTRREVDMLLRQYKYVKQRRFGSSPNPLYVYH